MSGVPRDLTVLTHSFPTRRSSDLPRELYKLTRGATVWRYTNWPVSVTVGGNVWTALDIERGELTEDVEFSLDPVSLFVATDDATNPFRTFLDVSMSEKIGRAHV